MLGSHEKRGERGGKDEKEDEKMKMKGWIREKTEKEDFIFDDLHK